MESRSPVMRNTREKSRSANRSLNRECRTCNKSCSQNVSASLMSQSVGMYKQMFPPGHTATDGTDSSVDV